jgi:hypothetical protein
LHDFRDAKVTCAERRGPIIAKRLLAEIELQMNHATAGCLGDSICSPNGVELVDQSTNVELGCMG